MMMMTTTTTTTTMTMTMATMMMTMVTMVTMMTIMTIMIAMLRLSSNMGPLLTCINKSSELYRAVKRHLTGGKGSGRDVTRHWVNLGVALRFNHRGTFTWFRMDKFVAGFGFGKRREAK